MTLAVYPGSFDPITLGHVDIVRRAMSLCDRLILAVARNAEKAGTGGFTTQERVDMARLALEGIKGVEVDVVPGLLAEYCQEHGATAIVKGLRSGSDLDKEVPMALLNRQLGAPETVFLVASPAYSHVSSTLVKDVARYGGDISGLVSPALVHPVTQRMTTLAH